MEINKKSTILNHLKARSSMYHKGLLQNCPRHISADVRKMKIYNWSRGDLTKCYIRHDTSKLLKKRPWCKSLQLHSDSREHTNITKILPGLRGLAFLSIDFTSDKGANFAISNRTLICLSKALCNLKQLRALNINLENCKRISEQGLKCFASKLKRCRRLEKLIVNTEGCGTINEGFSILSHTISRLQNISNLQVNLDNSNTSDGEITKFVDNIGKSKSLTELTIDLHLLTKYDVAELVGGCLPNIRQLTRLRLDFSFCLDIGNNGVFTLSRNIPSLVNLHSLELSFEKCSKITDKAVEFLGEKIIELHRLNHLQLEFLNCPGATEAGLKALSENIVKLRQLQHFNFGFGHWQNISDEGLGDILETISKAPHLKNFELAFEGHSPQSDGGMLVVANHLFRFTKLLQLSLVFYSRFLTDRGVQMLAQSFSQIKHLTHLKLHFDSKSRITDDGIVYLSHALGHLQLLEALELKLVYPRRFSAHGLFTLANNISQFNVPLKIMKMIFSSCEGLDDIMLLGFIKKLSNLNALNSLEFVCFDCEKITDNGIEVLSKALISEKIDHISIRSLKQSQL